MNTQRIFQYRSSCPNHLFIHETADKGLALFAKKAIKRNQHLFDFKGQLKTLAQSTPMSLQLSEDLFLTSDGRFDDLVNHSCSPNCAVHFNGLNIALVALTNIKPGEEITFNYNTTEWDLIQQSQVFGQPCSLTCRCGNTNCQGEINGFKYLPLQEKIRISHLVSPFLRLRMMEELWRHSLVLPGTVTNRHSTLPSGARQGLFVVPS